MSLPTRKIGNTDVAAIGFGTMGLSTAYPPIGTLEERLDFLDALYKSGCTNWDTADVYGDCEDLLGAWFKRSNGKRSEIFLATKFGLVFKENRNRVVDGSAEHVRAAFDKSLQRLGVDSVDLYYLHRPDPIVPIEVTVGAMAELVNAGKVKYLGLSECSAQTLRRAHAVHPISALQVEYSPFVLDIEDEKIGLIKVARELGVTIVAYSPLGRGLLTGNYKSPDDFPEGDFRLTIPRFSTENFPNILKVVEGLKTIGDRHGATSGQIALAWLLAQGDDVIPIPGTKKVKYLAENLDAFKLKLTKEEIDDIRDIAQNADLPGERYPSYLMSVLFGDTPEA
ncbi:hypothetical protein EW026_g1866 [Hermanssonia centrifuga]|uniref:NADP-dependent oxidoreductase domain-containing protein n=1 Tax=Hermanssonia centrifuga TaxID=98765 RepID=A0A4S4KR04_9APHY|nr:hypothetical protein EW026_g1866 [Hermanssonia centrifuga]